MKSIEINMSLFKNLNKPIEFESIYYFSKTIPKEKYLSNHRLAKKILQKIQ